MSDKMQVNKRLFFGLNLTPENKASIFNWLSASVMSNRKPVQEHNLHLTLAFLPNVNQLQEEELISFANRLTVNPFNLSFSEVGYWQNTGILFLTKTHKIYYYLSKEIKSVKILFLAKI